MREVYKFYILIHFVHNNDKLGFSQLHKYLYGPHNTTDKGRFEARFDFYHILLLYFTCELLNVLTQYKPDNRINWRVL